MTDRETIFALIVGSVVAVALHVAALSQAPLLLAVNPPSAQAQPPAPKPIERKRVEPEESPTPPPAQPPDEDKVKLGRDDVPPRVTVAWIPYDDFRQLVARKSITEQPAVQTKVDPTPNAPLPDKPTPPAPPTPRPSPPVAAAVPTPPATPAAAVQPLPTRRVKADSPKPIDNAKPIEQVAATAPRKTAGKPTKQPQVKPVRVVNVDPAKSAPTPAPDATKLAAALGDKADAPDTLDVEPTKQVKAKTPEPDPTGKPAKIKPVPSATTEPTKTLDVVKTQPTPVAPPQVAPPRRPVPVKQPTNPTAAPRDDKESPPTILDGDTINARPGRVITGRGIEIKTVRPEFSIVTLLSAVPRNPRVKLVFAVDGRVTDAKVIRSSGYLDIDGVILASLYRWRAAGKLLEERDRPFTLTINLLLSAADSDEADDADE